MVKSTLELPVRLLAALLCCLCLMTAAASAASEPPRVIADSVRLDYLNRNKYRCGTNEIWEAKYGQKVALDGKACPSEGPCDYYETRDSWIPGPTDPIMYLHLYIHILAEDDGSNVFSTAEETNGQIATLQENWLPYRIQWLVQVDTVNSTAWRYGLSAAQVNSMKNASAVDPAHNLNMWVTQVGFSYSFGTFPWDGAALGNTGGVVMGHFHWGEIENTPTHEIGHCLGLWHTFHGVEEVSACGSCGEWPGCPSPDTRGDLCSDTPPTPEVTSCTSSSETSTCGDMLPYGYTMPENYMGYTPSFCIDTFTDQQAGRMYCWINDVLDGWTEPFNYDADTKLGPAPLDVQFAAETWKQDPTWDWDFGDGDNSTDPEPLHQFSQPGTRTITIGMSSDGNDYEKVEEHWVCAYADTMKIGTSGSPSIGSKVSLPVRIHNYCDLTKIYVPFTWVDGPLVVNFDSVSYAGTRVSGFQYKALQNLDVVGKRATLYLYSGNQPALPEGDGVVANLWFSVISGSGECPIRLISYAAWDPSFETFSGEWLPPTVDGGFGLGCCIPPTVGDLDQSGQPAPSNVDGIDLSIMLDGLFISLDWTGVCLTEADLDFSGQPNPVDSDIDGIDLSTMLDALFISLNPLPACP